MVVNPVIFLCMCLMGCMGFVALPGTAFEDKLLKGLCLFMAFEGIALFILEHVKAIK